MARFLEVTAQLAAGVVQRLVERAAGGLFPVGEHVDRDLVERQRNEHGPLTRGQSLGDADPDRAEQLALLRRVCRPGGGAREHAPRLVLDGHLPPLPRAPAHLHRGLVERELVGPGREPREAAELVEASEDREEGVVRGLLGDVVEVPAKVRMRAAPAAGLEPGGTQEEPVEPGDGVVAGGALRAEVAEPCARLRVERRDGARAVGRCVGERGGPLHTLNDRRDRGHAASISSSSGARIRAARTGGHPRSPSSIRAWRS